MFNVILMDIRMPGINGVETFKRIKKIRAVSIFIFISAYAADELVIDALKEGATGIIFKPVDFNVLEKLMRDTKNNTPQKCQQYT
jgi:DNA-binding NarL/FixJ family response regulator